MPAIYPLLLSFAFAGLFIDIGLFLFTCGYGILKCHKYDFQRDSLFLKVLLYANKSFMENCCYYCLSKPKAPVATQPSKKKINTAKA